MGLHQIKKLLHIKGNNFQNQETTQRMGEIFINYSSDKRLISRIYKELKKSNTKRTNNTINKWSNTLKK
jgi:uridine kinase